MDYLFSVNKRGTVLFHPDVMNLSPELRLLTDDEKLIVVLVADYNSPFNQLPESDRKHKASIQVFGKSDNKFFDNTVIKNAIEIYKSLQYNPKRELLKVYQDKIIQLSNDLINASSPIAIKNIMDSQEKIRKSMDSLSNELMDQREEKLTLKGGGQLSFLEQILSNKEAYNRAVTKR